MTAAGLTPRQAEVVAFVRNRVAETGIAPTYEEIAAAVGMKAKSNVTRIMELLVERGAVRAMPNRRARAIEIVDPPKCCPHCGCSLEPFQ